MLKKNVVLLESRIYRWFKNIDGAPSKEFFDNFIHVHTECSPTITLTYHLSPSIEAISSKMSPILVTSPPPTGLK